MALVSPTILVVDDYADAREMLVEYLTFCGRGHTVVQAADGTSALAIARRVRPQIVLLDLWLPDIDGYTVARALKDDAKTRDAVIIGTTARIQRGDRQDAMQAGCDAFLLTPFDLTLLGQTIGEVLAVGKKGLSRLAAVSWSRQEL